ncbi:PKD domain-containing protein [Natronobeatus ordinarius]|uniref:PKD domain-containing protein n=1 Tax=Natronobeatus ordinarius TaxID=2963433 RepID=UPI0020CD3C61|nr:PKD domain-containing protein [Natronobeatus ordinarius]
MKNYSTLVIALVMISIVTAGSVAIAVGQEEPPGKPASFYGEAVDEDGNPAAVGTTIVAVVDGDVRGQVTVDTAGEYGGPDAFDEKLSLDSAAGDEVSFHVGEPAGPEALESPINLSPGTSEQPLTFPSDTFEDDSTAPDPEPRPEPDPDPDPDSDEYVLELLAEQSVDHDHACLHGDYDDRTPLEAGNSPESAPVESDDHVIWSVTYEGTAGYVTFDATDHWYDGPFVFYMADGSVEPTEADVLESGDVADEYCDTLEEYIKVETPDDGTIVLELTDGENVDSAPSQDAPRDRSDGEELEAVIDTVPSEPVTGENVTITASGSTGGDTAIVAYEWTVNGEVLTGKQTNTTFEKPGKKEIELTVENERGNVDTNTTTINVSTHSEPFFEVTELTVSENVTPGTLHNVTATITNTGEANGTVTVTHTFDGEKQNESTTDVRRNETVTVEFGSVVPAVAGQYQHTVSSPDDNESATITVEKQNGTESENKTEAHEAGQEHESEQAHGTEHEAGQEHESEQAHGTEHEAGQEHESEQAHGTEHEAGQEHESEQAHGTEHEAGQEHESEQAHGTEHEAGQEHESEQAHGTEHEAGQEHEAEEDEESDDSIAGFSVVTAFGAVLVFVILLGTRFGDVAEPAHES